MANFISLAETEHEISKDWAAEIFEEIAFLMALTSSRLYQNLLENRFQKHITISFFMIDGEQTTQPSSRDSDPM